MLLNKMKEDENDDGSGGNRKNRRKKPCKELSIDKTRAERVIRQSAYVEKCHISRTLEMHTSLTMHI